MASGKTSCKGLKICCGVTAILIVLLVIVITALSLTIFKPKQPEINARPVGLKNITITPNLTLNVTLEMVVTIDNRNYGSFKFENSAAYINYRGEVVAEVPIEKELVPARGKINITTSADLMAEKLILDPADLMAEKLILDPYFWNDVEAGSVNLTSTATLHGKVTVLNIFKLHARAISTCDVSFWIGTKSLESKCKSKIKL